MARNIAIVLTGTGGELDREEVGVGVNADTFDISDAIDTAIRELVSRCTFALGDTISIVED